MKAVDPTTALSPSLRGAARADDDDIYVIVGFRRMRMWRIPANVYAEQSKRCDEELKKLYNTKIMVNAHVRCVFIM